MHEIGCTISTSDTYQAIEEAKRMSITDDPTIADWTLEPGDSIERKALQAVYGGRTQGGIGPSRRSPNVLLFSDLVAGEPHGYFDGWMPDGLFHYTGEGQFGDQRMASGNGAILNHRAEGRSLRL